MAQLEVPIVPHEHVPKRDAAVHDVLSCHRREDLEHLIKKLNAEHGRQKAALREVAPFAVELDHELVVTPRRNAVCHNPWHEGGVASEGGDHVRLEPALVGFLVNLHHLQKKERESEKCLSFSWASWAFSWD